MNLKQKLIEDRAFLVREGVQALWWKQPFAGLMLHGKIETRKWATNYRGWVLIMASKGRYYPDELRDMMPEKQANEYLCTSKYCGPELITGVAIAVGRLVDCRLMTKDDEEKCFVKFREPWLETSKKTGLVKSKALWCHVYEDVTPVEPFALSGVQGWLKLSKTIIQNIQISNYEPNQFSGS